MSSSVRLLRATRLIHLYLGVFITPALLFFAFTGAIQTFSLHETTKGSSYTPPAILVKLGQLHKKQTLVVPVRKGPALEAAAKPDKPHARDEAGPAAAAAPPAVKPPEVPAAPAKNLLPMKLFFLLVSIGLFTSTLTGLYMAYRYARNGAVVTAVLAAGILVPVLLLVF